MGGASCGARGCGPVRSGGRSMGVGCAWQPAPHAQAARPQAAGGSCAEQRADGADEVGKTQLADEQLAEGRGGLQPAPQYCLPPTPLPFPATFAMPLAWRLNWEARRRPSNTSTRTRGRITGSSAAPRMAQPAATRPRPCMGGRRAGRVLKASQLHGGTARAVQSAPSSSQDTTVVWCAA